MERESLDRKLLREEMVESIKPETGTPIEQLQKQGFLYHATLLMRVPGILREGLDPKFSNYRSERGNYLCLTPDIKAAIYFVNYMRYLGGSGKIGILGIYENQLPNKIREQFEKDPLSPEDSVRTYKTISPEHIQEVIFADQGIWEFSDEFILKGDINEISGLASKMGKNVKVIDFDFSTFTFNERGI